ncbi:MAG: histidine kinase [Dehalococcoidia bacterium]
MTDTRIKEIEEKMAEMRKRIPPHSIPPRMLEELEDLEEELQKLRAGTGK